jgi:hypothetical protein
MHIRTLLPAVLCVAGLCLAACDSSTSSPADSSDPNGKGNPTDTDGRNKANGSLVIEGKNIPVFTGGVFDDTSMSMVVSSNVPGGTDTTWIVSVAAKPGKNTLTLPRGSLQTNSGAVHFPDGLFSGCSYSISTGSLHVDSWSETASAFGKLAKMSGGAVMTLSPDSSPSKCPALNATLTFTDASASHLGP